MAKDGNPRGKTKARPPTRIAPSGAPAETASIQVATAPVKPAVRRSTSSLARFEPSAILFDFDGVLVHSEPLHYQAMRDTLAPEGIDLTEQEYFTHCIGFDDRGAFRATFALHDKTLDAKTMLRVLAVKSRRMREVIHEGKYAALPGVSELVRGLVRNYPLAICSGALRDEIEAMLEGIGLRDCFETIVSAEDVDVGKPDPRCYVKTAGLIAERLGQPLSPKQCLIVEDAPKVIENAKTQGFRTLGVAGSYGLADLAHADARVSRLNTENVLEVIPKLRVTAG